MNNKFLKYNLHWQKSGWNFEDVMQLRGQLTDMDPFISHGCIEIQNEIGGKLPDFITEKDLNELQYLIIDDHDFNGNLKFIANCEKLEHLFICGIPTETKIADLVPISNLKKLKYLHLQYHAIKDLTPLRNLHALEELYVSENCIRSIEPLYELNNLKKLSIGEVNELEVFELLKNMPQCKVSYIHKKVDFGYNAFWKDDWAFQTMHTRFSTHIEIHIIPLLHSDYERTDAAIEKMKKLLFNVASSLLQPYENITDSAYDIQKNSLLINAVFAFEAE